MKGITEVQMLRATTTSRAEGWREAGDCNY